MDNKQNIKFTKAPEQPLGVEANKIKLKMLSYVAILEQEAKYMEEESKAVVDKSKELEEKTDQYIPIEKELNIADERRLLSDKYESMKIALISLENYIKRSKDMTKKALMLPDDKLVELARKGSIVYEDNTIINPAELYEESKATLTDDEDENIFSSIDPETIQKQVDNIINNTEKDEDGKTLADKTLEKLDNAKTEPELDKAMEDITKDIRDEMIKPKDISDFLKSDATSYTAEEVNAATPSDDIFNKDNQTFPSNDNNISAASSVTSDGSSLFDNDKEMEEFVANLEARREKLKVDLQTSRDRNNELTSEDKNIDEQQVNLDNDLEKANKRKTTLEKRIKYYEAIMPEIEELNEQLVKQNEVNSLKEKEIAEKRTKLESTTNEISKINSEADALETRAQEIVAKMSQLASGNDDTEKGKTI